MENKNFRNKDLKNRDKILIEKSKNISYLK